MMMTEMLEPRCGLIREKLASAELNAPEALHLTACEECRRFAEALTELDSALSELPEHRPAEGLVRRVLDSLAEEASSLSVAGSQSEPFTMPTGLVKRVANRIAVRKYAVVTAAAVVLFLRIFGVPWEGILGSVVVVGLVWAAGSGAGIAGMLLKVKNSFVYFILQALILGGLVLLTVWLGVAFGGSVFIPILFRSIEGFPGAFLMVAALLATILTIAFSRYLPRRWSRRYAPTFALCFVAVFLLRAQVSLFFGSTDLLDAGPGRAFQRSEAPVYEDRQTLGGGAGSRYEQYVEEDSSYDVTASRKKAEPAKEAREAFNLRVEEQPKNGLSLDKLNAPDDYNERARSPQPSVPSMVPSPTPNPTSVEIDQENAARALQNNKQDVSGIKRFADEKELVRPEFQEMKARAQFPFSEMIPASRTGGAEYANDLAKPALPGEPSAVPPTASVLERFLAERRAVNGVRYQNAFGYWANTYLPGDATFRRLHSEILGIDFSQLERLAPQLKLQREIEGVRQPFDAPQSSALALYLAADRRGADGPARLLLQVGLKGAERRAASRPPMRLAVVLDLRDRAKLGLAGEILYTLTKKKDYADSFSLYSSLNPSSALVSSENFKYGYLHSAIETIRNSREPSDGRTGELLQRAMNDIFSESDANAPLGSAAILLITDYGHQAEEARLIDLMHKSAVTGAPVSVIGLGRDVTKPEITNLALAGQGSRRVVNSRDEAIAAAEAELASVSAVIARAIRLKIRLAEGVKLVDVIGSHELNQAATARVKAAEKSIDQRVAKSIGIAADRGEDEDGVQIIIPAFYAGDSHVILLDVTAAGPGKVAEVTARYKDLVYLKNGLTRADASVDRGSTAPGPLEVNVLKNFLAARLAQKLAEASRVLERGDYGRAEQIIRDEADLREGLRGTVALLSRDAELEADIELLRSYGGVIPALGYRSQELPKMRSLLNYLGKKKVSSARPLE